MRLIVTLVAALALLLVIAAPALAVDGSAGAGQAFGQHHAMMGQEQMLNGDMNPGMHQGFAGWTGPMMP